MNEYQPTPKQEQAIRDFLQEAIVPLIEQVLVKKLGQAMSYAATELVQPKREWKTLDPTEIDQGLIQSNNYGQTAGAWRDGVHWAQMQLKEKNDVS
jgi:hypothetical protein